ncbi:endonuclease MutS2 [Sanyastnella coralliicola]|uniref:endonuclease MutS2 n=1 Tax=Sanyastnella coralliicola TaxID=3069118 RepID=UPI0027B90E44|nr:MutS2/Smr-associated SH3 domain-containing protein [Longitalea sp. SCSIO 12813]
MDHFDEQVVKDLEFDLIRIMLHDHCINETAQLRAAELTPLKDKKSIIKALEETREFQILRTEGHSFPGIDYTEMHREIKMLKIRDSVLEETAFTFIRDASDLVNRMIYFFDTKEEEFPRLWALYDSVYYTKDIIEPIDQVFDNRGKIRDDASSGLQKIRQEMTSVRRKINRNFNKVLKDLTDKGFLSDTREGFISDRRVLAVQSTHKRKIPGAAMGTSKTGNVTYIEPSSNVPLNHEFEMLLDDERREIRKILMELTRNVRRFLPLIEAYNELLIELDFINARTKLALDMDAHLPGVSDEQEIELIKAYHPVLLLSNKEAGIETHPQSLRLDRFSRMLVISGPNAGGKSITLKMCGLLQLMLQSGLLIPADPNSKMSIFHSVLTDIGDNQSIENQLSTYSYRLNRMKHFLNVTNRRTLLLLDEFGTGSDPELGGALAEVFFESLYQRKCFGVITTHYANIKLKAAQLKNAMNGSMLFDKETLNPIFKLDIGQPGSSFTFEVAEINGIDKELIEDAKSRLDDRKVKMDKLIADLQTEKSEYNKLTMRTLKAETDAKKAKQRFEDKLRKYEERLAAQQEIIDKNNDLLNRGRKLNQFVDRFKTANIKGKKKPDNRALLEDVTKYLTVEKSRIEEAHRAAELKRKAEEKKNPKKPKPHQENIKVGSTVRLIKGGKKRGTVLEINGSKVTVAFGNFKTIVELTNLAFVK